VLAQIGAINPENLPIVGSLAAEKLMDESLPSNELMGDAWTNISE
jgi:carboxymethylenebutenolidase